MDRSRYNTLLIKTAEMLKNCPRDKEIDYMQNGDPVYVPIGTGRRLPYCRVSKKIYLKRRRALYRLPGVAARMKILDKKKVLLVRLNEIYERYHLCRYVAK